MSEYIGKTSKQPEPQGDRPKLKEAKEKIDLSAAIKARVAEFFEGADLTRDGAYHPDAIREIHVESTSDVDNRDKYPSVEGLGDTHLYSTGRTKLTQASSWVNGVEFARITIPQEPDQVRFHEIARHNLPPETIDGGFVTAIYELHGAYETPDEWDTYGPTVVSITVLDFSDGRSRAFFPAAVQGVILPPEEKIEMARQLGVKVKA